jgi:hypothetical protein
MIVFIYKWLKNAVLHRKWTVLEIPVAGRPAATGASGATRSWRASRN